MQLKNGRNGRIACKLGLLDCYGSLKSMRCSTGQHSCFQGYYVYCQKSASVCYAELQHDQCPINLIVCIGGPRIAWKFVPKILHAIRIYTEKYHYYCEES